MGGTEFVIKIDIIYFLGIIGSLIAIAWYASHRFSALETSIDWIKRELERLWDSVKDTARRVMVSLIDDPLLREIKEYAFKKGLDVDLLLRLGGLLLRDNFLHWEDAVAPISPSKK